MVPDNLGIWLYHCHVEDHMDAGMVALYRVEPLLFEEGRGLAHVSEVYWTYRLVAPPSRFWQLTSRCNESGFMQLADDLLFTRRALPIARRLK
jgi:hypothetical protein